MGCGDSKHNHVYHLAKIPREHQIEFASLGLHEYHVGRVYEAFNELDMDG